MRFQRRAARQSPRVLCLLWGEVGNKARNKVWHTQLKLYRVGPYRSSGNQRSNVQRFGDSCFRLSRVLQVDRIHRLLHIRQPRPLFLYPR